MIESIEENSIRRGMLMIDRKKLTIGLITSMVTILIYLDQQKCGSVVIILSLLLTFFVSLKTKDQRKNKWSFLKRGRDKSRLGLRNWRENRLGQKCFLLLSQAFFDISEKPNFWTLMWKTFGLENCFPHKEGRRLKA